MRLLVCVIPNSQAELLDNVETEAANLAYLKAALYNFALEDVPGLILSVMRMGISSLSAAQLSIGLQYTFSVLMCGFTLCNTKNFIQTSEKAAEDQKKLGDVLEKASTSVDAFEGVAPREPLLVIQLRRMLESSFDFDKYPRDVLGDLMLLRRMRELFPAKDQHAQAGGGTGKGADMPAALRVLAAAAVTAAMAERSRSGANVMRERILRNDLASSVWWRERHSALTAARAR